MIENVLENVKCINCSSDNYKIVFNSDYSNFKTEEDFLKVYSSSSDQVLYDQLVKCNKCDLSYLNPRVKEDIIMESYSSAEDDTFFSQNPQRIRTFSKSLKKIISKNNITASKDKKVLDIGCAGAAFPKAANDLGFTVTGIEPAKWLANKGRETYKLDIRPGILLDHHFDDKTFDIVTLWDVIEHITDPAQTIIEIKRILKDDGIFVVNYPDIDTWPCKLLGKKWPFYLSVHLFYFTPKTIREYLNKFDFKVETISPYYQTLELGYVLKRAESYFGFFKYFRKAVELLRLDKLPCTYYIGQTLVIARKK
ncbi:methionine biosynthesis protein MetW-like protein [Bacteriovorax sp. BSW11_IV]|uniref:class I SAM-dependent methyltransferase n=1 Tax=Bacteriovorax sp. BSW11_IV TaxID=1353529 RepID=UPI00038A53BF|nr:class I SAM-dependent methyltransferase [Bacteriovorax sp. BSW11_IV]EQC45756.1 methionine biosynthesis protein MetW-like protein [Bacteriovorax sp. BSW11_IV]